MTFRVLDIGGSIALCACFAGGTPSTICAVLCSAIATAVTLARGRRLSTTSLVDYLSNWSFRSGSGTPSRWTGRICREWRMAAVDISIRCSRSRTEPRSKSFSSPAIPSSGLEIWLMLSCTRSSGTEGYLRALCLTETSSSRELSGKHCARTWGSSHECLPHSIRRRMAKRRGLTRR